MSGHQAIKLWLRVLTSYAKAVRLTYRAINPKPPFFSLITGRCLAGCGRTVSIPYPTSQGPEYKLAWLEETEIRCQCGGVFGKWRS